MVSVRVCVNCIKFHFPNSLPIFSRIFGQFSFCSFELVQSNPVPGLCPCCKNPKNSDFLQSIHSEGLFKMVEKLAIGRYGRTKLGRRYLFCNQCINWGKSEVLRLREEERLHQAGPSHQSGPLHQAVSFQHGGIIQHHGALQQSVVHAQPHYSPVSDPEGSHSTPEPFNMNQMYTQENLIGARLANPNDSPIHLGTGKCISTLRFSISDHTIRICLFFFFFA